MPAPVHSAPIKPLQVHGLNLPLLPALPALSSGAGVGRPTPLAGQLSPLAKTPSGATGAGNGPYVPHEEPDGPAPAVPLHGKSLRQGGNGALPSRQQRNVRPDQRCDLRGLPQLGAKPFPAVARGAAPTRCGRPQARLAQPKCSRLRWRRQPVQERDPCIRTVLKLPQQAKEGGTAPAEVQTAGRQCPASGWPEQLLVLVL